MDFSIIEIKIDSNFGNKFFTSTQKVGIHGEINNIITSAE